ncbi:MAG: 2-amino-4-hydroxy-6-hydroxymethyldihydropteridine diphosphokinase [Candidatus Cloacimonadota bacterium]|nr:MAG: 2-amino-4-hydroxy-6-hydroxymethyldihydropteridine diphosphokinase [Candidatus Cloacimonadota bacterium]
MSVLIGLGSNIGDRKSNLEKAEKILRSYSEISVIDKSKIIETEPFGVIDQPYFLNRVLKIKTDFKPTDLLAVCLDTEKKMGRIRVRKWGERKIDVDILVFDEEIVNDDVLILPHPGIAERKFVLESLVEIVPDEIHPVEKKTYAELYEELILNSK